MAVVGGVLHKQMVVAEPRRSLVSLAGTGDDVAVGVADDQAFAGGHECNLCGVGRESCPDVTGVALDGGEGALDAVLYDTDDGGGKDGAPAKRRLTIDLPGLSAVILKPVGRTGRKTL